jgi:ABC-type multidrug transport system permease subunit
MESPFELSKVWAMTRRDMLNWTSYKSQVFTGVAGALVGLFSWALLANYNAGTVPEYNTNFTTFLVTGVLIFSIISPISRGLDTRLGPWTLETVLMTGLSTPTFVLGSILWTYILAIVFFVPQLLVAIYVFNIQLSVNVLSLIVAAGISSLIVFSLSMVTAGIRIVTKVTDPITWFLAVAQGLFAGMTFPIQHLDSLHPGLSTISWLLPQTWIYHIIRLATITNASLLDPSVAPSFLGALVVGLVLLPLGLYGFRWGMRRAKRDGTIGFY